jgi:hypothetical protein
MLIHIAAATHPIAAPFQLKIMSKMLQQLVPVGQQTDQQHILALTARGERSAAALLSANINSTSSFFERSG